VKDTTLAFRAKQRRSARAQECTAQKVAQSCAAQNGANPPKRKVSEQSKDLVREQQNAQRKCINEYVATKKQGRSRYAREEPSKLPQTRYCECRLCLLGFLRRRATSVLQDVLRAATRRATSVQQDALRLCNNTRYERAIDAPRACNTTRYMRAIDTLLCATTHYGVCESGALHDTEELPGALQDTGKLPSALHDTGEFRK
jgi:hypothetical protein